MKTYDLYSVPDIGLTEAKIVIEQALNIQFEERDSFYHGEYCAIRDPNGESLMLKINIDPLDNEPAELDFPDAKLLLYVDDTRRADALQEILHGLNFLLLRRKHI